MYKLYYANVLLCEYYYNLIILQRVSNNKDVKNMFHRVCLQWIRAPIMYYYFAIDKLLRYARVCARQFRFNDTLYISSIE